MRSTHLRLVWNTSKLDDNLIDHISASPPSRAPEHHLDWDWCLRHPLLIASLLELIAFYSTEASDLCRVRFFLIGFPVASFMMNNLFRIHLLLSHSLPDGTANSLHHDKKNWCYPPVPMEIKILIEVTILLLVMWEKQHKQGRTLH